MRQIKAAAIQMKCDLEHKKNLQKAEQMIRKAAAEGANIILLPELFEREYFCQQRIMFRPITTPEKIIHPLLSQQSSSYLFQFFFYTLCIPLSHTV